MRRTQLVSVLSMGVAGALAAAALAPITASASAGASATSLGATANPASAATAAGAATAGPRRKAVAKGYGGAVSTVDPEATRVGLRVLRKGGNAVDAAVATAAALGVTEPYSAGIGGGGYFVYYDAEREKVMTIDGRETAPKRMSQDSFIDPATDEPYPFSPELVTSGVSVGVPGTLATWEEALDRWGTASLEDSLEPSVKLARKGFKIDDTFRQQTLDNADRFKSFTSTKRLFLSGGDAPQVGSTFKNPDLADTYELIGNRGTKKFYSGFLAKEIVEAVRKPPTSRQNTLPVPPGRMKKGDLRSYRSVKLRPTQIDYRGYDVYGMLGSSSGGITVGEALNIMERYDLGAASDVDALHTYLEASALAFADRGAYIGDRFFVKVPWKALLDDDFAAERACNINPDSAATKPVAPGEWRGADGVCPATRGEVVADSDTENISTTNMTVADRFGNVVEYTLTIEQTGGSGIVVPNRGFLLNNELTDFSTVYDVEDPNRIQPGKRPRSSMSPTIVLKDGKPFFALGSPGGSTIITTVLQTIFNRIDRDMTMRKALAAPRATQRNRPTALAEQAFIDKYGAQLAALGHTLESSGDGLTSDPSIGAATAIEFGKNGRLTAVAEPTRRGGGSAGVVAKKR